MPGVKAVHVIQEPGTEIQWAGDEIAAVAATRSRSPTTRSRAIKVEYEVLPHFVREEDLSKAGRPRQARGRADHAATPTRRMAAAEVDDRGHYGMPVITHCCLEPHGQITEWEASDKLNVCPSTQAVSALAGQIAEPLGIPGCQRARPAWTTSAAASAASSRADRWGIVGAALEAGGRQAGQAHAGARRRADRRRHPPLDLRQDQGRRQEGRHDHRLAVASPGARAASAAPAAPPLPYVFADPEPAASAHLGVAPTPARARAWRAPNHPQACFLTMSALEDLAAALSMDPLDCLLQERRHARHRAPRSTARSC